MALVRHATIDDLPEVMRLLVLEHGETGIFPLNPAKVAHHVGLIFAARRLFVVEAGSGLAGILGIVENGPWYSDASYLTNRFLYVEPEFRAMKIGAALMAEAKAESDRHGGLPLILSITNEAKAKKRGRIAAVLGYFPLGWLTRLS